MFHKIYGDETKCFQFWQKPLDVNFRQQTQESCFACCVARLLLLNWNSVDKRWGAVGWFQKLCCIYLIYICRLFSFRGYFQNISSISYCQLSSVIVSYHQLSAVNIVYRLLLLVIVSYRHPQKIWNEILHGTTSIYNLLLNFWSMTISSENR